jgi:HAD superfamily hydrolase (TIGR01490 family)
VVNDEQRTVAERLARRTVLVTGASGFLGKAVVAVLLREASDLREIRLVLRAGDEDGAQGRLRDEVLPSEAFDGVREGAEAAVADGRLRAIAGDLGTDGLGRADGDDSLAGVDVAIHCAASVSFEEPLDRILDLNVLGALRLAGGLRSAAASNGAPEPAFVHVSTAYAAGNRTGLVLERRAGEAPEEPEVDVDAELAAARAWRDDLEAESRLPDHQARFAAEAAQDLGPAGSLPVGRRAEELRRDWIDSELVERGRRRCRTLGWADGYSLSKALAERALSADPPPSLTVVRPSIIESALRDPHPGWLEGIKVADPIILAYARGMVSRFPGGGSGILDIVPVDLVANACVVAAAHPPASGSRTLAIASGRRNALSLRDMADMVTDHFAERPLPDEEGAPIEVSRLRFDPAPRVLGAIDRGTRAARAGRRLLDRIPVPGADAAERRLHVERRRLERLRRLAEIYGPYVELDCVFDDSVAQELLGELDASDRARLDFDTAAIDWSDYFDRVHLPALRRLVSPARLPRATGTAVREPALPDGPPAIAFLDIEGVVVDTTIAHFYAWLRSRGMPGPDRIAFGASLAARAPGWAVSDRRSRAGFNRAFYRTYRGLPAAELRAEAAAALDEHILPRIQQAAVRRIRAHRRRGDRVVLLTGALDFLVEPLRALGDELISARLIEDAGVFTGELAEPPLTAEGRAAEAARVAAEHGIALGDCHAYADSISDLPLLEAVGHAHPVNPDFRLEREARRRRWTPLHWKTEPGARSGPPAPVAVGS